MRSSAQPTAVLGAGELTGFVWGTGVDACLSIARVDRDSGIVDQRLTPKTVRDLARLAAMFADALSHFGELPPEHAEELGTLARRLAPVLDLELLHDRSQLETFPAP